MARSHIQVIGMTNEHYKNYKSIFNEKKKKKKVRTSKEALKHQVGKYNGGVHIKPLT